MKIAHAHEYGAVIKPVNKQWLAIPVTRKASKTAPLRMDLHFVKYSETKAALLDSDGETQFVLLKKTVLPERSFLRACFDQDQEKIAAIVEEQVRTAMLDGKSAEDAMNAIGGQVSDLIRMFIRQNRVKPPTDSARKSVYSNSRTTLVDTGNSISGHIAPEVV